MCCDERGPGRHFFRAAVSCEANRSTCGQLSGLNIHFYKSVATLRVVLAGIVSSLNRSFPITATTPLCNNSTSGLDEAGDKAAIVEYHSSTHSIF